LKKYLRPSDLAKATGLGAQTIRNYEAWGILPQAERGPQGYRLFTQNHLQAIRVMQSASAGFGWRTAAHIMTMIHRNDLPAALAAIDEKHAIIHQNRREVEAMLTVFHDLSLTLPASDKRVEYSRQRTYHYVKEAAQEANVRVSALRFWEEQGLLQPIRDKTSRYRLYDEAQIRQLKVVALLRKTGYGFEAIRAVLAQMATGTPEEALKAAEHRLRELTEESRRCMAATAMLWDYITHYYA
jgi:DNA-binding transcriptional MerR regulator